MLAGFQTHVGEARSISWNWSPSWQVLPAGPADSYGSAKIASFGTLRPIRKLAGRLGQRKRHGEDSPAPFAVAFDRHGAAMRVDQLANERQPDPEPRVLARIFPFGLLEPVEDERQELRRDAAACVADLNQRVSSAVVTETVTRPPGGVNLTAFVSGFQNTCCNRDRVARRRRPDSTIRSLRSDVLPGGVRADGIDRHVDDARERDVLKLSSSLPARTRDMSSSDSTSLACAWALQLNRLNRLRYFVGGHHSRKQELCVPEHGVERGSELVRQDGDEVVFQPAGPLHLGARLLLAGSTRARSASTCLRSRMSRAIFDAPTMTPACEVDRRNRQRDVHV